MLLLMLLVVVMVVVVGESAWGKKLGGEGCGEVGSGGG